MGEEPSGHVCGCGRAANSCSIPLFVFLFCTDCMIELALNNVPVHYLFVHFSLLKLWADTFVQDSMVQGTTRETRLQLSF